MDFSSFLMFLFSVTLLFGIAFVLFKHEIISKFEEYSKTSNATDAFGCCQSMCKPSNALEMFKKLTHVSEPGKYTLLPVDEEVDHFVAKTPINQRIADATYSDNSVESNAREFSPFEYPLKSDQKLSRTERKLTNMANERPKLMRYLSDNQFQQNHSLPKTNFNFNNGSTDDSKIHLSRDSSGQISYLVDVNEDKNSNDLIYDIEDGTNPKSTLQ